jgi:hypothetical protein
MEIRRYFEALRTIDNVELALAMAGFCVGLWTGAGIALWAVWDRLCG